MHSGLLSVSRGSSLAISLPSDTRIVSCPAHRVKPPSKLFSANNGRRYVKLPLPKKQGPAGSVYQQTP